MRPEPYAGEARARAAAVLAASSAGREVDNVLPFRRRRGVVKRRRRSPLRRWLLPFLGALAIVGAPTGAVTWVMTSPRFALARLAVTTGERVSEDWVRRSLAPVLGHNVPLLALADVERLLRRHPWVRGADLRKDLPAGLTVRLTEKRAVALWRDSRGLHYVDSRGELIEPLDPLAGRSVDLLLVSRPREAGSAERSASLRSAIALMGEIDEVRPFWSPGLSEIEVLGEKDFRVHTASVPFPLLVRAGTLDLKARRLEELLPRIVERFGDAAAIDLRFARRIIVQPSAPGSGPERRT